MSVEAEIRDWNKLMNTIKNSHYGYYIHKRFQIGINGPLFEAIKDIYPFGSSADNWESVSKDEYEKTILDWRYEDGEWQQ